MIIDSINNGICPLCGKDTCRITPGAEPGCKDYYCETYERKFKLHTTLLDSPNKEKILYLITEFLTQNKSFDFNGQEWDYIFYYKEENWEKTPQYVNTYNFINLYPNEFMDKAIRALINLSNIFPNYGMIFQKTPALYRAIYDEEEISPTYYSGGMYQLLVELGYLKENLSSNNFYITAEGWKKVDEIKKNHNTKNQGFIAMSFKEETKAIREAFKKAITESGYSVSIIDEKEHNNQIVPEIFYEINKSKFVVVDVTYPNYGAYYEAGYAQALGKQVIICCRDIEFSKDNLRPHFDISQKSMVVWHDELDLIDRLKKRIKATVI